MLNLRRAENCVVNRPRFQHLFLDSGLNFRNDIFFLKSYPKIKNSDFENPDFKN